ncbi:hypothetical protein CEE37_14400 [candidate division LCP-89 bacterium B3_LCP]|uniref:NfeD-like C-terminal domain-containing protein n=1 Tax=candidate division LCP-89 bacterium B3_LCP TaxID=2012998 RepID=A0A532UPS9_UNCL8|nr:MAG: hypothetical protein CEE37_14400 [candidate division LCP-89 bacterium B3_LCP]
MLENLWWVWVVVGILLIVIEIATTNFIVMWFGIASIITAIPVYFEASTEIIIITYAASLLILTTFVRKITMDWFSRGSSDIKTNVGSLVSQVAIVTEDINVILSTGKVKVGKEVWSAISDDKDPISKGERVKVIKAAGVKLIVTREN